VAGSEEVSSVHLILEVGSEKLINRRGRELLSSESTMKGGLRSRQKDSRGEFVVTAIQLSSGANSASTPTWASLDDDAAFGSAVDCAGRFKEDVRRPVLPREDIFLGTGVVSGRGAEERSRRLF